MNFEVVNALCDLDRLTPEYILEEMFAHSDGKSLWVARGILGNGIAGTQTARTLCRLMSVDSIEEPRPG